MGYLTIARRRWAVIGLLAMASTALALVYSYTQKTLYTASAAVQVHQADSPFRSSGGTKSDLTRAMQTQMDLVRSDAVKSRVRADLGVAPHVTVGPRGQSDEIQITATASTARAAADIANAYARGYVAELAEVTKSAGQSAAAMYKSQYDQLQAQIDQVTKQEAQATGAEADQLRLQHDVLVAQLKALAVDSVVQPSSAAPPLAATIVASATRPSAPSQPRTLRNGILGLAAGLVIGFVVAAIAEGIDDRIRDEADVRFVDATTPVLGPVPMIKARGAAALRAAEVLDPFRALRATVGAMIPRGAPAVIEVTAPSGGEGASTVAAALATTLTLAGRRVTLIDCNLTRPRQHVLFGCSNDYGVADYLRDPQAANRLPAPLIKDPAPLRVIPAGAAVAVDMLASAAFATFVSQLLRDSDVVVIDAPPILSSAEAMSIGELATITLIAVRKRKTRRRQLRGALQRMLQVNSDASAVVLTEQTSRATVASRTHGWPLRRSAEAPAEPQAAIAAKR